MATILTITIVVLVLPIATVGPMEPVLTMDQTAVLLQLVTRQQQPFRTVWEEVLVMYETPDRVGPDTVTLK